MECDCSFQYGFRHEELGWSVETIADPKHAIPSNFKCSLLLRLSGNPPITTSVRRTCSSTALQCEVLSLNPCLLLVLAVLTIRRTLLSTRRKRLPTCLSTMQQKWERMWGSFIKRSKTHSISSLETKSSGKRYKRSSRMNSELRPRNSFPTAHFLFTENVQKAVDSIVQFARVLCSDKKSSVHFREYPHH